MKNNIFFIARIAVNVVIFAICLYFFFNPLKLVGQEHTLAIDGIVIAKAMLFVFMLHVILRTGDSFYGRMKGK